MTDAVDRLVRLTHDPIKDRLNDQLILLSTPTSGQGPCSLNKSPKHNWVEDHGGLPTYICNIARAIAEKGGKDLEAAIPIAISRVKVWATGKGVDSTTQAKATKAVAQWEALKAKAHGAGVSKKVTAASEKAS